MRPVFLTNNYWRFFSGSAALGHVTRFIAIGLLLIACLSLQACFPPVNNVRESHLGASGRKAEITQIVYGVGVAKEFYLPVFSVAIDQYDPATGKSGDCGLHNQARAQVPPTPGDIVYFTFDVPAGAYLYSLWNMNWLDDTDSVAFIAPKGKTVYLGDYMYAGGGQQNVVSANQGVIRFRRDLGAAKKALGAAAADVELAETLPGVRRGSGFVCSF